MQGNSGFLKCVLCVTLCVAVLWGSVSLGDNIGVAVNSAITSLYNKDYQTASVKQTFGSNSDNSIYSATGYGGGGYTSAAVSNTPTDIAVLKNQAQEVFKNYTKAGVIKEIQMGATVKTLTYGKVKIDNKAEESISIKSLLNSTPSYGKITKKKPYILIYHTHSTEGYEMLDLGWFAKEYNSRTKDKSKNMIRVGDELTAVLEEAGYNVIHDRNIYDESYNGAYNRSRVSVEKYLEKYPSIQITLDVHRDAIYYDSKTHCKPTAEINGKKAAQVMIISGCEGDGVENFLSWKKNLVFAAHLQNSVEESYEGLMRPVFFCHRRYNMDVTPCSLLLEFGTDANTLEEAVYSAQLIGNSLVKMLEKNM